MSPMDQTQRRYIDTILPWRLKALRIAHWALSFVDQYPEGGEYECKVKGELKLEGKSSAITAPPIEMGTIHSRVLLEFLGLGVNSEKELSEKENRRGDDISIESFDLPRVTKELALSRFTVDRTENAEAVEAAFVRTVTAANKIIAHSTTTLDYGPEAVMYYAMCCEAIPELFKRYFYEPLKLPFPDIEVTSRPAIS